MGFFDRLFRKKSLSSVNSGGGWTSIFGNGFHVNFQTSERLSDAEIAAHHTVFTCISLISQDIGKMPILLKRKEEGVWIEQEIPENLRALKKPNGYQNWQQFSEQWTISLLLRGNAYVLKHRDLFTGKFTGFTILNPDRVKPLISDKGEVFYQLSADNLSGSADEIVPASEIIHDRINCFYHPLVGMSPISACEMTASHGLDIQKSQRTHFKNNSRPGGVLSAPGPITEETANRVKKQWNENYSGENAGCTAVVGDGLKFEPMAISAADSQLIEQLKMTTEIICSVFHVPAFKVDAGSIPAGQKVSDLNEIYYSDCLQSLIEARENLLDDALALKDLGFEAFLDLDVLIRMDSVSQMNRLKEGVGAAILTPNEARLKLGLLPLKGGNTVYMQQQNYSLEALAKRDQKDDPFGKAEAPKTESKSHYQGVFKTENQYKSGQFVTHKGSLWHCEKDHSGEFSHENFKLAQKKWGDE
ncbi:phage portal protein [Acinetobacter sp. FL51]|uniref:phage portal protein n=1 Tax=Acinetobacter sp. FL51 TaxID=2777978 RepID=UPI0018E19EAC|nr:phage portal protein [Acinetobacter sp. FL51]MBI1450334.1 phage portal protein [Acinetobacter sp. FL51]